MSVEIALVGAVPVDDDNAAWAIAQPGGRR